MAVAAPPEVDVYAACYDLGARFWLDGPAAIRRERLPPIDPLLAALGELDPDWSAQLEGLLWRHDSAAELERAEHTYMQCVVVPVPGRYVPPYASVHLGERTLWGDSTREMQRLYAAHGLEWRAGATRAQPLAPDHLGLELAFLAVAQSDGEAWRDAGEERFGRIASFLDGHLLRWVPRYLGALHATDANSLITDWVEWLLSVARHDLERPR